MIVVLQDESGNDVLVPSSLDLRPLRYESSAQGGPTWADIRVDGDAVSLWRVLNWLAYRVQIRDAMGVNVWWGQVNEVELSIGTISLGVSLDTMANSVAVIWANNSTGGMTAYTADQNSIDKYGLKQLLISVNGVDESTAVLRRDWEIARRRYPTPTIRPGSNGRVYASLRCEGWFRGIKRTYYTRDEGVVEYMPSGGVSQRMGWGFTTNKLGFTARGRTVSDGNAYINSLDAGEYFRVSGSYSNNSAFTVESSSERTAATYTASTIAFLRQERRANGEYMRASHSNERKLNNFNLYVSVTPLGTTTAASGVNGTHTGSNDAAVLTDSGKSWTTDEWVGRKIINVTDGSEGTIKANTATTITVSLYGGQDNDWDSGDAYIISYDEIWLSDASVVQNGDRIRIALDAGGYFQTFVRGAPDTGTGKVLVEGNISGLVSSGRNVDRVNRWVTSENGETFYVEGTDYTIAAAEGTITTISGGAITNNSVMKVSYIYTEYRIEDSDLGLAFVNAGDMIQVTGGSNAGWYRVISTSSEGDRCTVREPVSSEAPGTSITVSRGANIVITTAPTEELPGSTSTVYAYGWRLAQSFQIPSDEGWKVYSVEIRARKIGAPSDNLRVRIFTNNAGAPGSEVESSTIAAADVPKEMEWLVFPFLGTNTLSPATTYWVMVDRSGSADPLNYYEVTVDEDLSYTGGLLLISDGTSWQTRPNNADLPFRILGKEETTVQIVELIEQDSEYIGSVDLLSASGIFTNQYRDGSTTAVSELLDLLEIGTTNNRRLLATVTPDLVMKVEEEPAQPETPEYLIALDGNIYTKYGVRIPLGHMPFVGQWVHVGAYPPTAEWSYLNPPSPFLVESAQYDVESMTYQIEPANNDPVWRIGMRLDEG